MHLLIIIENSWNHQLTLIKEFPNWKNECVCNMFVQNKLTKTPLRCNFKLFNKIYPTVREQFLKAHIFDDFPVFNNYQW